MTLSGHTSSVNACSFSPDGNLVISTSDDKMLKIWDAGTGMPIKTIECHSSLYGIRMSQDGTMIAVADCEAVVIYHRDSEAVSRLGGYANAAMSQLPPRYGEALTAKYLLGHSVGQIARAWQPTEKAVESQLSRARRAFREIFLSLSAGLDGVPMAAKEDGP
jgi:WD40 repeat protein